MMVIVENIHNGVRSQFTDAEWANVQAKQRWRDTFKVVSVSEVVKKNIPKELEDLQRTKTQPAEETTADAGNSEAPVQDAKAKAGKADKPAKK